MYLVGDTDTHRAFLSALGGTHGYDGLIETWFDGVKTGEVDFEGGTVRVSGRSRERRALGDVRVPETLWPTRPTDLLTPFGAWVTASVTIVAGATRFPPVPVFAGRVLTPERDRWSGQVIVAAADPMWQVNREPFEQIRLAPAGARIVDTIRQLLVEVFPAATLQDLTGSDATVPTGVLWDAKDGSRGKAVDDLAASIGAEVYARPTVVWPGGDFVIRPVPSLHDPVAWQLPDGDDSIIVADRLSQSGATVVNRWIVTSERADTAPFRAVVTDDDPASPTRYGGPMGHLTRFLTSPIITTENQGIAAGRAKLNRSIGLARTRTVTLPANPALDAGDVLLLGVDGETPELHISDDFAAPLTYDPPAMSVNTRSTGGDT